MFLLIALACSSGGPLDSGLTDTGVAPDPGTGTHLVFSQSPGLELVELDGTGVASWSWDTLVGDDACTGDCDPQELALDGDGLLAVYADFGSGSRFPGGVARLVPTAAGPDVDWHLDDFSFPHDAQRVPGGDSYLVVDTLAHRLVWVDPATGAELAVLDDSHPDWVDLFLPNGMHLLRDGDRTLVLMSSRGSSDDITAVDGRLVLWDVTDPAAVEHVWRYPETGTLSMPHGPLLRPHDGGWLLAYAHTQSVGLDGITAQGSAGFGWTADLSVRPDYLGDCLLPDDLGPLRYHRGLEVAQDGTLYLAESVDLFRGGEGRLSRASLPALAPTGLTGAWDEDGSQLAWFTLDDAEVLDDTLDNVFQVRLFTPGW